VRSTTAWRAHAPADELADESAEEPLRACEPADELAPAYELALAYEPALKAEQDVHAVDVHLARVCGVADPSKEFWMGPIKC